MAPAAASTRVSPSPRRSSPQAGRSSRPRASATCARTSRPIRPRRARPTPSSTCLDHLGIDRVPVVGGSAGALSAMQFAIRHPDRCAALVALVPAAFAPGPPSAATAERDRRGDHRLRPALGLPVLARHDAGRGRDDRHAPRHRSRACPRSRARLSRRGSARILHDILPVSDRARGLLNDGKLAGSPGADGPRDDPRANAGALARGRPLRDTGRRAPHRRDGAGRPAGELAHWRACLGRVATPRSSLRSTISCREVT